MTNSQTKTTTTEQATTLTKIARERARRDKTQTDAEGLAARVALRNPPVTTNALIKQQKLWALRSTAH